MGHVRRELIQLLPGDGVVLPKRDFRRKQNTGFGVHAPAKKKRIHNKSFFAKKEKRTNSESKNERKKQKGPYAPLSNPLCVCESVAFVLMVVY